MSKIGDLRGIQLLQLYKKHKLAGMLPTSLLFLWYEMVQAEVVPKHASGIIRPGAHSQRQPKQDVIDALTDLRESGDIPWSAVVDETRSIDDFTGYRTIAEGVNAFMDVIRLDAWRGRPPR